MSVQEIPPEKSDSYLQGMLIFSVKFSLKNTITVVLEVVT